MQLLRVLLKFLALVLLCASCSSQEDVVSSTDNAPEIDTSTEPESSTVQEQDGTTQEDLPFANWSEYGRWQAPSRLTVDGADVVALTTHHECFNDECQSPLDYWLAEDVVVAAGSELTIESGPSTALSVRSRRLGDDLVFISGPSGEPADQAIGIQLDESGLYHIDVQVDLTNVPADRLTRFRHFLWILVVDDPGAPCLDGASAAAVMISGVVGVDGCPSTVGELDIDSLHPEFHCHPWPATLRVDGRPGQFVRHAFGDRSPDLVEVEPADLTATGGFLALGEIFESPSDVDAVYIRTADGAVERWATDSENVGCA